MSIPARVLRIILAALLAGGLGVRAWAQDRIVDRAVFEDLSGRLSIAEVVQQNFRPMGQMLSRGYVDSAYWVRLTVQAPTSEPTLALRIRPSFLDDVDLYEPDPLQADGWRHRVSGDRQGYEVRELGDVTLGFVIRPAAPSSVIYLRVKTSSSMLLNVEALAPAASRLKDLQLHLFQIAYLAVMLCVLMWALGSYYAQRQPLTAWFILYQASFIGYDLALNGYLAPLMPPGHAHWADGLTTFVVLLTTPLGILFYRSLFALYGVPRRALRLFTLPVLLFPVALAMAALGLARLALQANALLILLVGLSLPMLAWSARHEAQPSRRAMRVMIGLQTVSLLISTIPLLGWLDTVEWRLNASLIHGLISAVIIFSMLERHARHLLTQGLVAMLERDQARARLLQEQERTEEKGRFIAMITHELKTPLAVISLAFDLGERSPQAQRHARRAVSDMEAIVEHYRQVDMLNHAGWQPRTEPCSLDVLLADACDMSGAPERIAIRAEALAPIQSDSQLLGIILSNLIDNALKYGAPATQVEIGLRHEALAGRDWARLDIENAVGPAGLPDPDKLYLKYHRGPRARGYSGSGLGLYLVRGFTERLGGRIDYTPTLDRVRFTLWLPL